MKRLCHLMFWVCLALLGLKDSSIGADLKICADLKVSDFKEARTVILLNSDGSGKVTIKEVIRGQVPAGFGDYLSRLSDKNEAISPNARYLFFENEAANFPDPVDRLSLGCLLRIHFLGKIQWGGAEYDWKEFAGVQKKRIPKGIPK